MSERNRMGLTAAVLAVCMGAWEARGQRMHVAVRAWASNIVVPQSRTLSADPSKRVTVTGVKVGVVILEQAAATTMDISLHNPTARQIEAEMLVPVPAGAVVRSFTFQGAAKEPTAEVLPKDKALSAYKSIVSRMKDPALLEFAGYNVIRSSVFPVPARGGQKIRLTYENLLSADGNRIDYILPRSESVDYKVPWEVSVRIKSKRPISTVYSPSHQLVVKRLDAGIMAVQMAKESANEPGPFQLSYLQQQDGALSASLFAYPDPEVDGGYFLLLVGLPPASDAPAAQTTKREITFVIDRSGSMEGDKLEQAKAAALQVIQGLRDGEAFNVIDYSDSISSFAAAPVIRDGKNIEAARHYVRALAAGGGTNLHDALLEALRQAPVRGMLPIVLFLTDGLPTIGVRSEVAIRTAAAKANVHRRRIFTFGVGYDVNVPLLDHLSKHSRATNTVVLPKEDVEAKVSQVYRRLWGPVLAGPGLRAVDAAGRALPQRIADPMPPTLGDIFEGDRLVVLGKYKGSDPLRFQLQGTDNDRTRTFTFEFPLAGATTRNSFVPRLWASRKIEMLVDEIRQAGAEPAEPSLVGGGAAADPKMKELTDEIVRLSIKFGILTEYTAFLAREGTDLSRRDAILQETNANLVSRAQGDRRGQAAVNQQMNADFQRRQIHANRRNEYVDQNLRRVQITQVQQVNDRAFFRRGSRWVDADAINSDVPNRVDRTVHVGSPEFLTLVDELVRQNRQGMLSMSGEILLRMDGRNILVTAN